MTSPTGTGAVVRHVMLDRDGVLNREMAEPVVSPDRWTWEAGALEGLRILSRHHVRVSVATNQSCVGRGICTLEEVDALHRWLGDRLTELGVDLVGIFVCPHVDDDHCRCRKPAAGLLRRAIECSGVAPSETVFVGDAERDLLAARTAHVRAVLVRTGKGAASESSADGRGVEICDDLAEFARRRWAAG